MNEELHTYLEEKFSEMGGIVNNALTSVEARIDERIDGVDSQLARVEERLDRIENRLIAAHERDIEPRWPPQIPPAVAGSNSPSGRARDRVRL